MPFCEGNSKLGKPIITWSIPAGSTCPGKSAPCGVCYAQTGFFHMNNVKTSLEKNLELAQKSDFVDYAVSELTRLKAKVVRIHVAGDMYDVLYTRKWLKIIKLLPNVRFFLYTRSWRIPEIRSILTKMSKLPNLRMWWSVDWDTGKPINKPSKVRLAYLQMDNEDIPTFKVDLIFRHKTLHNIVMKKINSALICPVENGVNVDFTCAKCGFCWRDKNEQFDIPKLTNKSKRHSLPTI
jgi:hypothetical protein